MLVGGFASHFYAERNRLRFFLKIIYTTGAI